MYCIAAPLKNEPASSTENHRKPSRNQYFSHRIFTENLRSQVIKVTTCFIVSSRLSCEHNVIY
uniref:Uncharacterized protein n=1 Tax=Arundo donax TaxID=35708 RepID=A0A0A9FSF5_ARUDO